MASPMARTNAMTKFFEVTGSFHFAGSLSRLFDRRLSRWPPAVKAYTPYRTILAFLQRPAANFHQRLWREQGEIVGRMTQQRQAYSAVGLLAKLEWTSAEAHVSLVGALLRFTEPRSGDEK